MRYVVRKDCVRRLYDKGTTGNAGVVRGGGIISPIAGAVPVLPLADGDGLHLAGQRSLGSADDGAFGIVFENVGIRGDIGKAGIFRILHQSVGDVSGDVDRVLGLRIVVADIADVGNHAGAGGGQLVLADRQDTGRSCFAGGQSCLGAGSVLSLPQDSQARGIQSDGGLVEKDDRSQDKMGRCPAGRIGVRQHVRVFALRLRQIGSDIGRELSLVCDIHERLLAGSQNRRHSMSSYMVISQ